MVGVARGAVAGHLGDDAGAARERMLERLQHDRARALAGDEAAAADVYADDYLYDLKVDPVQLNNVVADPAYAEAKAMLRGRLLDWIKRAEGAEPTIVD